MRDPVVVLTAVVSVEFVLYTVCLCAPEWLVQREGSSEGLFSLCNNYQGFSSCTTFPAWVGTYSLSWMFLAGSSALSFSALFTIRPALVRGRRAVAALLLNITSVVLCASALIAFLVAIEKQSPQMFDYLGWSFYICCATLFYALVVSVILGLVRGLTRVEPSIPLGGGDEPTP